MGEVKFPLPDSDRAVSGLYEHYLTSRPGVSTGENSTGLEVSNKLKGMLDEAVAKAGLDSGTKIDPKEIHKLARGGSVDGLV